MSIFNLFGQKKQDPYWEFDKSVHYRPKLNKGDLFRLTGSDFCWFVLEPIDKFVGDRENEIEKSKSLSYGQKALYFWWYVDARVSNGGFTQFYYEADFGKYMPTAIKALQYIGDKKMADLLKKADDFYPKNREIFDSYLAGEDDYPELEMDFDGEYFDLNEKTMVKIEKYIRKNPNEFFLDENGNEFDMKFSGECKTLYENGQMKEVFNLEKGVLNGVFKSFYENENPKEIIYYQSGELTGEREEFYENGNKKYTVKIVSDKNQIEHFSYYGNGNPQKLEHKTIDSDKNIGEYKTWYDNGQLEESGTYISDYERNGEWLEFYRNGNKKLEAEFKNGYFFPKNSWLENGEQTLKDGTGTRIYEFTVLEDCLERNEEEYKNYKKHGKQLTYRNGVLTLYQEMENGKENGITRAFYKNGKIKEEKIFKDGKKVSEKEFPMFENPQVVTKLVCKIKEEWLINRGLELADQYPQAINAEKIQAKFVAPLSLFDGYSQDEHIWYTYLVTVGENGKIEKMNFCGASNCFIEKEVESMISQLVFHPAKKDGKQVQSYTMAKFTFILDEN